MRLIGYGVDAFTRNLRGNISGGITAAVVALPLALAFGISSGLGPIAALYGAVAVGFFASVFGGTAVQISGPTGPMTVVITAMATKFLADYPDHGPALVFTVIFMGGIIQMLFGLFRLGKYFILVPYPVISGFMTGIGIIIILLQIKPLLGLPASGGAYTALQGVPDAIANADPASFMLGSACLFLLFAWRGKLNQLLPAPMLVLILASVLVILISEASIHTIGTIPSAAPSWHWPYFESDLLREMFINALVLAVLGTIDTLLTSLVADNMTGDSHDSNRELVGQGIGNAVAGMIGGLPGAGATMRTVVNIRSGGDGPLSGAIHSLILLSVLMGLGSLFENIPLAALAAVLIKVGLDIIDWPFLMRLRQMPKSTVGLMLLVLGLTVFVDLITAVFIGVFIKNLMLVEKLSSLELGNVIVANSADPGSEIQRSEADLLRKFGDEAVLIKITGSLSYAVSRGLTQRFKALGNSKELIIDLSSASMIGVTTLLSIEQLIKVAQSENTKVSLIVDIEKHRSNFRRLHFIDLIGRENCYESLRAAADNASDCHKSVAADCRESG